jgi:hypothetical protein
MSDWNTNLITAIEKWSEGFEFVQHEGISLRNVHIILEFCLAIPGTSAFIERLFYITNVLWTDEKNSFLIETIKAVTVTKLIFRAFQATTSTL